MHYRTIDIDVMDSIEKYYLLPENLFVSKSAYQVTTLLGTCVAVTLWDSIHKYGGINHYMLPIGDENSANPPRYGNISTKLLIEKMLQLGCKKENLKAKVFGGSDNTLSSNTFFKTGKKNVDIAYEMLERFKIPIIAENVGGNLGRKVIFYTDTGRAFMKFLKGSELKSDIFFS